MTRQCIISFISLAMALLLAGCAKEGSVPGPDVLKPVRFTTSSVNEFVFKSTEGALATGDYIGVFAGSPISRNNVKMRVNGSALEYTDDADRIYWTTGQTVASNFVAYEPWIADGSFSSLSDKQRVWTVNLDQSSDANFYASDLKVANVNVAAEADVNLVFNHILAKVTLTITSQLASSISQVELLNVISSGTIDLDDGSVSNPGAPTSTVVAHQKSFNSSTKVYEYEAIVIPQSGANPSIRITVDGGTTYTYTLSSTVNLTSGANATAAFTILRPGLSAVFSSMSVSTWGNGSAASVNSEERSVNRQGGKWSIVGAIHGTNWDEDIYMIDDRASAPYQWKIDINYTAGQQFKFRYNNSWDKQVTIPSSLEDRRLPIDSNQSFSYGDQGADKNVAINTDSHGNGIYRIYLKAYDDHPEIYVQWVGEGE